MIGNCVMPHKAQATELMIGEKMEPNRKKGNTAVRTCCATHPYPTPYHTDWTNSLSVSMQTVNRGTNIPA